MSEAVITSLADTATTTFVTKASYTLGAAGAGGAVVFGYTTDQWTVIGVVGGLTIALLGFVVGAITNLYYQHQHYALALKHANAIGDVGGS